MGPLSKNEFISAFANFKLEEAFPDRVAGFYAFRVDPFETNRVWFDSRFRVGAVMMCARVFQGVLAAMSAQSKASSVWVRQCLWCVLTVSSATA